MVVRQRQLSLEEFLRRPERKPALEYMNGVVTQKVSPKARHSVLQTLLAQRFNLFVVPRKLAFAFCELRTTFAGVSVVPDVAVFRWHRIARDAAGEPLDDVTEPPDIAVEIVSPGQRVALVRERCEWYVENGVPIAVLVDPRGRSVGLFRADLPSAVLRAGDEIPLGDVLPGFRLTVQELFDSLKLV